MTYIPLAQSGDIRSTKLGTLGVLGSILPPLYISIHASEETFESLAQAHIWAWCRAFCQSCEEGYEFCIHFGSRCIMFTQVKMSMSSVPLKLPSDLPVKRRALMVIAPCAM